MKRTGVIGLGDMGSGLAKNLIETAYPDGYQEIRDGYLGHVHIKDVVVDTPRSHLEVREMGKGQLADRFPPMAEALRSDGYDGVVSFESVYHPGNGDFEAGFRRCIGTFQALFGRTRRRVLTIKGRLRTTPP